MSAGKAGSTCRRLLLRPVMQGFPSMHRDQGIDVGFYKVARSGTGTGGRHGGMRWPASSILDDCAYDARESRARRQTG